MAQCPKCKKHLKIIDWKQHCPHCGANIVLYDIQERLMLDADKAELQYFYSHKKTERMKASFVGSKLAIVRLVMSLVPVLAIVFPFINGSFKDPFVPFEGNFSLFTLLEVMENFNTDNILSLLNTEDGKAPLLFILGAIILFILSIVVLLIRFICLTMACSPKGKVRNYIFDVLLLVMCITGAVLLICAPANPYYEIKFIVAPIVYFALLVASFVIDILVFKQGIEINYEECFVGGIPAEEYIQMVNDGIPHEKIRQEMYKRLLAEQEAKEKAEK